LQPRIKATHPFSRGSANSICGGCVITASSLSKYLIVTIKQVQPTAFITSGFNTPDAFQPQEAIISGYKLGSKHINMLHTLSQNILTRLPTPHQYTSNTR
jgi:hypothetical protein